MSKKVKSSEGDFLTVADFLRALHWPSLTLPPWPLRRMTQRRRLVSYQFISMFWSKSQSHSRVLDVDTLTALVILTSWRHSTVKVTRFTSSTDFHFLLGYHQNKYATLQTREALGCQNRDTQSTQLVQNNYNCSMNSTSQRGCSSVHQNCLKITNPMQK